MISEEQISIICTFDFDICTLFGFGGLFFSVRDLMFCFFVILENQIQSPVSVLSKGLVLTSDLLNTEQIGEKLIALEGKLMNDRLYRHVLRSDKAIIPKVVLDVNVEGKFPRD